MRSAANMVVEARPYDISPGPTRGVVYLPPVGPGAFLLIQVHVER